MGYNNNIRTHKLKRGNMKTRPIQYLGVIDSNKIETDKLRNRVVSELFRQTPDKKIYDNRILHEVTIGNTIYKFLFNNHVLRRERATDPGNYRFEMISDVQIGSGAMGGVLKVDCTLIPERDGKIVVDTSKSRLVKAASKSDFSSSINTKEREEEIHTEKLRIETESRISRAVKLPGVKEAVQIASKNDLISFTVLSYIPGDDLANIIDDDKFGVKVLTEDERLTITILLLRALEEQVHDNGYIHRDLKPANIRIDLTNKKIFIIDYGISKPKGPSALERLGTPEFLPKEQWNNNLTDEKSDVYAMGIMLSELWKMPAASLNDPTFKNVLTLPANARDKALRDFYIKYKENDATFNTSQLNATVSDPMQRATVKHTIASMTRADTTKRFSSEEALHDFEEMRLHKKLDRLRSNREQFKKYKIPLEEAHNGALECRQEYRKLVNSKLNEGENRYEQIKNLIARHLAGIDNDPMVIEEFIETLGIPQFNGLTTRAEITGKMNKLYSEFTAHANTLLAMAETLNLMQFYPKLKDTIEPLLERTDRVLQKPDRYDVSFLSLEILNTKLTKAILELNEQITKNKKTKVKYEIMSHMVDILKQVSKTKEPDALGELKDTIRRAIRFYLKENLTKRNVEKMTSAASLNRVRDIKDILALLEKPEYDTPNKLIKAIESRLSEVKRGVFSTNLPLFKSIGKSELVNYIESGIELYKNPPAPKTEPKPR